MLFREILTIELSELIIAKFYFIKTNNVAHTFLFKTIFPNLTTFPENGMQSIDFVE